MARRASTRSGWRRIAGDPPVMGPELRRLGFVGCDRDPDEATGFYDRQGRLRRITASYPNGWRCVMTVRADGSFSLSQSISIRVTGTRGSA